MKLARPTPSLMAQYRDFWESRGRPFPGRPRHGIWVVEGDALIVGAGVFLTDGPYLLVEGFATNPVASLRRRHAAGMVLLESLLDLSAMLDRTIIMNPSPGIHGARRMAKRLGFILGTEPPIFGGFNG